MSFITRTLLKGLAVILPITITAYFLYWLGSMAETTVGGALRPLLPDGYYVPGAGVAGGFLVVFALGALMNLWLTREIVSFADGLLERVPLVKTLYGSVRDLMGFFSPDGRKKEMGDVVAVELAEGSVRLLGFLTREKLDGLPEGMGGDESVAVYLPMSYQVGGFTVIIPRASVSRVDMSVEEGMRFALTAGVSMRQKRGGGQTS